MDPLFRPPIDLTGSKSLRQFFQALNFRMVQETALAFGILAVLLSLLLPADASGAWPEIFLTVAPPALLLLLLFAAALHWICAPVRHSCERALGGRLLEHEEQSAAVGRAASLPRRLMGFGFGFWFLGWSSVALWTLQQHGDAAALPTAVGGLLAVTTTQLLSYFRNKRAFLPIAEALAERLGLELPADARLQDEFRRQLGRVFLLLSAGVVLLGVAALLLQAQQIEAQAATEAARSAAWRYALRASLALAGFGLGFPLLLAGFLSRELRASAERLAEAGDRIAARDLRRPSGAVSTEELSSVERSLRRIAAGFLGLLRDLRAASQSLDRSVKDAESPAILLGQESQSLADSLADRASEARRALSLLEGVVRELQLVQDRLETHALASRELDTLAESLGPGLATLGSSFVQMNEQLMQTDQAADIQDQRLDGLLELSLGATKSASELATLVLKVRRLTEESARVSGRVQQSAESGAASLRSRLEGLTSIQETISWASQSIGALGERSQEIGDILGVITSIAKQTNMLSLNAAIIASQAGEHGPGFNIIADEIRSLAEKTSSYTMMVEELVGTIVQGTDKAIEAMMVCFDRLSFEMEASHATEQMLETIARGAQESQTLGRTILGVTEQEVESAGRSRLAAEDLEKGVGAVARGLKDALSQLKGLSESLSSGAGMIKTMTPTLAYQRKRSALLAAELAETRQASRRVARDLEQRAAGLLDAARQLEASRESCDRLRAASLKLGAHVETVHNLAGSLAEGLEGFRVP